MENSEIKELWGEDLYNIFADHIKEDGWLTSDWSEILENEVPRWDKNYNDNPAHKETYNRMYLLDCEESADGLMIKPVSS